MTRIRLKWWVVAATVLSCTATISVPARAQPRPAQRPAVGARTMRGGGSWQKGAEVRRTTQRWEIDVTRADDDSLSGRVTLAGSPLMQSGVLRGKVAGRRIEGSLSDDAGNHVATFIGTLTPGGGGQGTYQDRSGEVGRWSWDGQF